MSSCCTNASSRYSNSEPIVPVRCGELVVNGGMESFTGTVPTGWTTTTPTLIAQNTTPGRVHSGTSSVTLQNGANLTQLIPNVAGGRAYVLSLFARAEGLAPTAGFTASVHFVTPNGDAFGGAITVPAGFLPATAGFSYYQIITTVAPCNTTAARIDITVTTGGPTEFVDLDDVSFSVQ